MIKELTSQPIVPSVGWFQSLCKCTVYKVWGNLQSAETEEVTWMSDETFLPQNAMSR